MNATRVIAGMSVLLFGGAAAADTAVLAPAGWERGCVERLERARDELARTLPAFAKAQARVLAVENERWIELSAKTDELEYSVLIRPFAGAPGPWHTERGRLPIVLPAAPPSEGGALVLSKKMLLSTRAAGGRAALLVAFGGGRAAELRFTRVFKAAADDCLAR